MARLYPAFAICVLATVFAMFATTGTSFAAQIGKDASQISPLTVPRNDREKKQLEPCFELGVPCGPDWDLDCCSTLGCNFAGVAGWICLPADCFDFGLKGNSTGVRES